MDPIRFVFGLHLHQPVGNFDYVFAQHVDDVYRPLLDHLAARSFLPAVFHISGPLLEWLETHEPSYLDRLGPLVADGQIELLLAGFYEPILASLPRRDRVEQIHWMHDAIRSRFGVDARGLWLTERVWEPELAADLADAGVRYLLVDDRHFLATGFSAKQLHAPLWTESDGKRVALFPIDERLRYLIPFRPPEETAGYLRELRGAGHRLAVLADDGEKFGGWPGTREWVYERGWLNHFTDTIGGLVESGEVRLSRLDQALEDVPSGGLAYLPTASYREMEAWSLPPDAAVRLARLERDLGEQRMESPDGALVRGAHWRNFLVKYPESNRMHKKMMALSALARHRGDPGEVRRAIGRAQCNDAYWHGVFGGLYLPHLRDAIWQNLAAAERELRRGQGLEWEVLDFDGDGYAEIWLHSGVCSVLVAPSRGGAIEEYTMLASGTNYANTLTRRREAYFEVALEHAQAGQGEGTHSIHEIEEGLRLESRPPLDPEDRAILVDRVLSRDLTFEEYQRGDYWALKSWARDHARVRVDRRGEAVEVSCAMGDGQHGLNKRMLLHPDGSLEVTYGWDPAAAGPEDLFASEISLSVPLTLECSPGVQEWRFFIETIAKSERGLDRTRQGESVTLRWPVGLGQGTVLFTPDLTK